MDDRPGLAGAHRKVVVEQGLGDARLQGDALYRGLRVVPLGKAVAGRVQNALTSALGSLRAGGRGVGGGDGHRLSIRIRR